MAKSGEESTTQVKPAQSFPQALPSGARSVMAQRHEALDSLDDFPTPPWATRALCSVVLQSHGLSTQGVWEPACNRGLMAEVLAEYFDAVYATDIFDYGYRSERTLVDVGSMDFLGQGSLLAKHLPGLAWIITNPPFRLGLDFALRALELATEGVALLVRTSWLEGGDRYERLFKPHPPAIVAQFCERVPMVKGRWDANASTATSYAWVVWLNREHPTTPRFMWIPPGQQRALTKPDDVPRFGELAPAPLLADLPRAHSPELSGGAT